MKTSIATENFQVRPDEKVQLSEWPTNVKPLCRSKKQYQKLLEKHVEELSSLQRIHYASNRYALLLIFQVMDAAGKDGAIRHVMSGVNPQGCQVFSSNSRAPTNLNMTFCGVPPAGCRNAGRSVFSIVPITRKCWWSECILRFCAPRAFRMTRSTTRPFGRGGIVLSWTWRTIFIATVPES